MCLAQGHNTVTLVGIEPRTSRFGVRRSTTTPPRSLEKIQERALRFIYNDYNSDYDTLLLNSKMPTL